MTSETPASERAQAWAAVGLERTPLYPALAPALSVLDYLRLAGHGLRTLADLDRLVLDGRVDRGAPFPGLDRKTTRAAIASLSAWCRPRFLAALARLRGAERPS